jgi:transposase
MSRPQAQKGAEAHGLGRSRGVRRAVLPPEGRLVRLTSTKIHLKTDFDGHPLAFGITGGVKADAPMFETLLRLGPDIAPRAVVADKGYDSRANRAAARACGAIPVIPVKANAANPPRRFARALYRGRARIEQAVGKLKRFKRIALRCEKTQTNFASFVALAIGFIWVQSVHTA